MTDFQNSDDDADRLPNDIADQRRELEREHEERQRAEENQPDESDGDGRADPEDFFVTRDEEGKIRAVETEAQGFGTVTVRPMTYGHAERYFGDVGNAAMVGPGVIANVLNEHVIDPDLNEVARRKFNTDGLDERVIAEEMTPFGPAALLMSVLKESGLDADVNMDSQGNASVQFEDGGNG